YRIKDDRTWSMLGTFPAEQVTALLRDSSGSVVLATPNPAKVHLLQATPAASGTLVSKVQDTETVSSWGRLRWQGRPPPGTRARARSRGRTSSRAALRVLVHSRSGNRSSPDSTWSDWSPAYPHAEGEPVVSER